MVIPFNNVLEMPLTLGTQKIFITMLKKNMGSLSCAFFFVVVVLFHFVF